MSSVEWDVHPIYKIYSVGFLGVVFLVSGDVCCVLCGWGRKWEVH